MIDFTKPVRTKNGYPVTILSTTVKRYYPVIAMVHLSGDKDDVYSYDIDGRYNNHLDNCWNLENIPEMDMDKQIEQSKKDIRDCQSRIKSRPYQQTLLDSLKDPKEAMAYLEAALEHEILGCDKAYDLLRDTVKNVIDANKEPEQFVWINVYSNGTAILCHSKEEANQFVNVVCEGRLTLTTGAPVTTTDVLAAETVFYKPYKGNRVALYDGSSKWKLYATVENENTVERIVGRLKVKLEKRFDE